jgi:methylamine---glutamate N-methyltransferase subunit B
VGVIDCEGKSTRAINAAIREFVACGDLEIHVRRPAARHNLGVGLTVPVRLVFEGSVGYYCGGMGDGPVIEVKGSAGWGAGECILGGTIIIEKNAGAGAAAAIRGGTVVVRGDVAARGGISMKGGTLVIGGNTGYMTGFMMQKGTVIVLGNTDQALGDSLYEGRIFVGGRIGELGNDAVSVPLNNDDALEIGTTLRPFGYDAERYDFKKIVAGRRLWNFDKKDFETWKVAL